MPLTSSMLEQLREEAFTHIEAVAELTQRICAVPAPTGAERERAEFVATLWQERGYTSEIDALGNVYVVRRGSRSQARVLMLLAHTDTVFPLPTPLTIQRAGDILRGPGIGDNCVSVAAMLTALEMLDSMGIETASDIVAVANVGEEGLGDLCGARAAVERYRQQLGAVLVVDGHLGSIVNVAVGSLRWRITVRGPGGHSFGSFGSPSAIHGLGRIIADIAALHVPQDPKTTFNVGLIEGGTSINTIAPEASALLDLRSTDLATLQQLARQVKQIIAQSPGPGLSTEIKVLGERPAGQRDRADPLVQLAAQTLRWLDIEPNYSASSTDANIPISLNIPAVCIGITRGEKVHTVDEYIHLAPIGKGLAQLVRLCIDASEILA